jgi:hypothetical protein
MALTFRNQINLKVTDPIVGVAINQQKISSDSETTRTFTGIATGGSTTTLIDTTVNFVAEGIKIGTAVTRALGGTSVVTSISTTTNLNDTLNFLALSGAFSFVSGNLYSLSTELNMNFTAETYELPALGTNWVKIGKGDIGKIRSIFLVLTSDYQYENIDVLITSTVDPNTPSPATKTFVMRDIFIATTELDVAQNIWIRNSGASVAVLLAIISGENV